MQRTKFKDNQQKMRLLSLASLGQARAIAWSFHKTTGLPYDELQGEAILNLCLAVKNYDPSKNANPNTYSRCFITNHTISYIQKEAKIKNTSTEQVLSTIHKSSTDPARTIEFRDSVNKLSNEAKIAAHIILNGPTEIMEIAADSSHCKVRVRLKEYLKEIGMTQKVILSVFNELKELFK